MKTKIVKKWISNLSTILLILVLFIMLFIVISSKASGGEPQVFGYQLKTVLSGSMEPGIKTGSIVAVKPGGDMKRFHIGDVITFKSSENIIVTHRIVKIQKNGDQVRYNTKGDNNKTADLEPVSSNNVLAEYTGFTIPYIGYIADYAKSKNGSALILLIPGLLLIIYAGFSIWKAISQIDNKINKSKPAENPEETI